MAFRTRRQSRYAKLRESGFLPFEANEISKVPIKPVPYMKQLISERRQLQRAAKKSKLTTKQYENQIKQMYKDKQWTRKETGWERFYDPWAMLRQYENDYRAKVPQYESPWRKRRQAWQDFITKYERTVESQRSAKR